MTTNDIARIAHDHSDPFYSARATTFLNFALHLRIAPATALAIATDALDDDSNSLDISTTPMPTDPRSILLALANESFNSDDDFDDFIHELSHAMNDCIDPDYCA